MNRCSLRKSLPCVAVLILFASSVATAQIEEIIVTATKRAVSIQDVPISISAYSGDFLENSDIRTLQDLSLYAPNFTMAYSSQPTNARILIRGIGSVGNSAIETSVGVFVDGVYYPRPGSVIGNLLDIETAEVLRGPQGTLFGRNTAAGALNLTTRDPSNEVEGYVSAGFGDYSAYTLEGVINAPFSDKAAVRLAAKYAERDGYGFNTLVGQEREIGERDDLTLRAKLGIDFTPNAYGVLTLDYNEVNTGGQIMELLPETASPFFDGTLDLLFGENATTVDGYDQIINQDHQDSVADEQWGVAFDLEFSVGQHTVRSITAYRDWQATNRESAIRLTGDVLPRDHIYTTDTISQEFQLLSPTDQPLTYVLGVFYYEEDFDIDEDFDAGVDGCVPVVFGLAGAGAAALCQSMSQFPATDSDYTQSLTSTAVFAQATYSFTDRFAMTLGGRYTSDSKDAAFLQTIPNAVIGGLFRAAESVPDLSSDDDAFTWLVNASFYPTHPGNCQGLSHASQASDRGR